MIETDRLILREWRDDADWEAFFEGTNTPAVMEWLGGVLDEEGQARQRGRVESCHANNGFCFWLVERKSDGGVLGFCGLKRADAPGSSVPGAMEVGWRLRQEAWGQGYAKEAAIAAIGAGFGRFGADEIVAITIIENAASWGLMKRLGMKRREDLDYEDERFERPLRDHITYSISRPEWQTRYG